MDYEKTMKKEEFLNDGEYACGYIDGEPATWKLSHPEEYTPCRDYDTFSVDFVDQYEVMDGEWREKDQG